MATTNNQGFFIPQGHEQSDTVHPVPMDATPEGNVFAEGLQGAAAVMHSPNGGVEDGEPKAPPRFDDLKIYFKQEVMAQLVHDYATKILMNLEGGERSNAQPSFCNLVSPMHMMTPRTSGGGSVPFRLNGEICSLIVTDMVVATGIGPSRQALPFVFMNGSGEACFDYSLLGHAVKATATATQVGLLEFYVRIPDIYTGGNGYNYDGFMQNLRAAKSLFQFRNLPGKEFFMVKWWGFKWGYAALRSLSLSNVRDRRVVPGHFLDDVKAASMPHIQHEGLDLQGLEQHDLLFVLQNMKFCRVGKAWGHNFLLSNLSVYQRKSWSSAVDFLFSPFGATQRLAAYDAAQAQEDAYCNAAYEQLMQEDAEHEADVQATHEEPAGPTDATDEVVIHDDTEEEKPEGDEEDEEDEEEEYDLYSQPVTVRSDAIEPTPTDRGTEGSTVAPRKRTRTE